jgi:acyl transferase domain-containing protein
VSVISNIFGNMRTPKSPLLLRLVKTNLGYGGAASAISSLIKTVLCLKNRKIPATIRIKRLNSVLNLRDGRLKVVQALSPWPSTQLYLRASIVSINLL